MIRPFTNTDKAELLTLLKLNIPQFFAESEVADFEEYLEKHLEDYFVVEEGNRIIGSGGINYFPESGEARLSWDIIHPNFQGKGIGRELTQYRINHIRQNPAIQQVVVRTTQLVYRFYEKMGFRLKKTEKDFWAPGFDLYYMRMPLSSVSAPGKV